ncbi:hypothetical protein LOD99_3829 [Oopsacas minuta]|uniref:Uncharacterized protein n=1 Tax=Oopsacas minuta TaxID=111878 RepID=A0AAV7JYC5_9METZ|nr:hypothetical protein LOD99_3829 [Oopsacas minuta]
MEELTNPTSDDENSSPKAQVPELGVPKSKPETEKPGIVTNYDNDLNYKKARGEGIIIVNEKVKGQFDRQAAEKDLEYLINIYAKYNINCDNNTYCNLEGRYFHEKFVNLSQNLPETTSVIFVSISSHGGGGDKVLGTEGYGVPVSDIVQLFQSNEKLVGIPKVFIVQACRGGQTEKKFCGADGGDPGEKGADVATQAGDTLIANSTSEGFLSWRDPESGSWSLKIPHEYSFFVL